MFQERLLLDEMLQHHERIIPGAHREITDGGDHGVAFKSHQRQIQGRFDRQSQERCVVGQRFSMVLGIAQGQRKRDLARSSTRRGAVKICRSRFRRTPTAKPTTAP